jgi:hypothetical protein
MRRHAPFRRPGPQHGIASVEFALVAVVLFGFIFGVMEVSRLAFLWSTMTEVTSRAARAAAMADFNDGAAKDLLRQRAMFLAGPGDKLLLSGDIGYSYLKIDYLGANASTIVAPLPSSGAENTAICLNNPNSPSCIRYVMVRLCLPGGGNCDRVPYSPLTTLLGPDVFKIDMPYFTAIAPIETLGCYTTSP